MTATSVNSAFYLHPALLYEPPAEHSIHSHRGAHALPQSQPASKIVIDTTNPQADAAPEQGVLTLFTEKSRSLMEILQQEYPDALFVKAFNSIGAASMIDPDFMGRRPTMFICGNDVQAKFKVTELGL